MAAEDGVLLGLFLPHPAYYCHGDCAQQVTFVVVEFEAQAQKKESERGTSRHWLLPSKLVSDLYCFCTNNASHHFCF